MILDGFSIAAELRKEIAQQVSLLAQAPSLAVVLVGNNPVSESYVKSKTNAVRDVGMKGSLFRLDAQASEQELLSLIDSLNSDPGINGILVQLPLPAHIDEQKIFRAINPQKDVDGFHPYNVGKLFLGQDTFVPCTPQGVIKLLKMSGIDLRGKHAVVVGRSNIVGKPLIATLLSKEINATVTVCHSGTPDISRFTKNADILIVAIGKAQAISADMIKPGAVVIDVGINHIPDATKRSGYRLVGDVDFEQAQHVAAAITPVPRGVGPMTVAMLLQNTLKAAELQTKKEASEASL